jgi:hypothetical protein
MSHTGPCSIVAALCGGRPEPRWLYGGRSRSGTGLSPVCTLTATTCGLPGDGGARSPGFALGAPARSARSGPAAAAPPVARGEAGAPALGRVVMVIVAGPPPWSRGGVSAFPARGTRAGLARLPGRRRTALSALLGRRVVDRLGGVISAPEMRGIQQPGRPLARHAAMATLPLFGDAAERPFDRVLLVPDGLEDRLDRRAHNDYLRPSSTEAPWLLLVGRLFSWRQAPRRSGASAGRGFPVFSGCLRRASPFTSRRLQRPDPGERGDFRGPGGPRRRPGEAVRGRP